MNILATIQDFLRKKIRENINRVMRITMENITKY